MAENFHCIYQIFLIHSFVVGHLRWLPNLALVNSAAINNDVQNFCDKLMWCPSGMYLGVE